MIEQPGILGTNASLASDLSLLAYIFLIVPTILLGFYFARRKMYVPHHKLIMTTVVLVNWAIILYLMVYSYREGVAPRLATDISDPFVLIPTIHLVTGGIAQVLATYLMLRMWLENILPSFVMVKNIKRYMRLTMALWLFTAFLGVLIYIIFYVAPVSTASDEIPPVSTEEASADDAGLLLTPEAVAPDTVAPDAVAPDAVAPEAVNPEPVTTEDVTTAGGSRPVTFNFTIQIVSPIVIVLPEGLFGGSLNRDGVPLTPLETEEVPVPVITDEVPPPATTEEFFDEDAFDDAMDATEDALDDLEDAARDAARATEEAIEEAMEATEDALDDRDD